MEKENAAQAIIIAPNFTDGVRNEGRTMLMFIYVFAIFRAMYRLAFCHPQTFASSSPRQLLIMGFCDQEQDCSLVYEIHVIL